MKKRKKTDMPPLIPEEEEDDTQVRGGSGAKWITLLCVILAIALIVASLPSGISAVTKVNSKVLSAVPEENTISTVLSGGGTLSPQEGTAQSLPQALELETHYVKNGQTVSEGAPIAQVDLVAVKAAISELQEVIDTLDAAIASESSKTNDSVIRSGTFLPGLTKVSYDAVTSPPCTFTAPISRIWSSFTERPVVSRSSTTKSCIFIFYYLF